MCIVPFHLNQQCTCTYSTKKMGMQGAKKVNFTTSI